MSFYLGSGGSGSGAVTTEPVGIGQGGTGATTAADARTNLGLGTIALQNFNNVTISGGLIAGITDLAIADGGTGASTAIAARANLLPSYSGNQNRALVVNPSSDDVTWADVGNGTVTSVNLTAPTGLVASGGPVTSSGILSLSYESGYSIPLDSSQTNWDTAYSWGDHALAGYLDSGDIGVTVQGYDATILKSADIGVSVQAYDSTILNAADIGVSVQAYDSTILNAADIGVSVQAYDSTILNAADIGVSVQAYDATILKSADIGVSVQAYDSNLNSFVGTFTLPTTDGTNGQVLTTNGSGTLSFSTISAGSGTVTSVDMTVPTGLTVSGNPITTSGTLAIALATGYSIPTTSSQSNWDTAYSWGNHASAGYLTSSAIGTTVQAYDADTAKYDDTTANFTGTLQNGGSNVLVASNIGSSVQAYDADTAKYDDATANFTGTLQKSGNNVLTTASTIEGGTY